MRGTQQRDRGLYIRAGEEWIWGNKRSPSKTYQRTLTSETLFDVWTAKLRVMISEALRREIVQGLDDGAVLRRSISGCA